MRFFCYVCQDRTFVHGLDQPVCATCHSAFVEELESEDSELRGPSVAELYEDPDVSELAELWDTALSSVFGSEERTRAEHDTPDDQEADSEEDQDSENWVDEESDREAHYHHPGAYFIYAYRGPPPWLSDGGEEYEEEFDDEYETEEESDEFYDSYDDYDTEDDLDEEDLESVDMYSREDLDRLYGQEDEDIDWETEEEVDDEVEEEEEDQDEEEIYVETAEYNSTASGSEESEYTDAEDMHHRDIFLDANEDGEDEEYYGYSGGWHIHEHAIHDHSHHLVHFITSVRGFREIWDAIYNDDDSLHPSYNGATDEEINKLPRRKLPLNHPAVDTDCTICHDKFGTELELINLPCRHEYHDECIRQWLTINASCPICRSPITPST